MIEVRRCETAESDSTAAVTADNAVCFFPKSETCLLNQDRKRSSSPARLDLQIFFVSSEVAPSKTTQIFCFFSDEGTNPAVVQRLANDARSYLDPYDGLKTSPVPSAVAPSTQTKPFSDSGFSNFQQPLQLRSGWSSKRSTPRYLQNTVLIRWPLQLSALYNTRWLCRIPKSRSEPNR